MTERQLISMITTGFALAFSMSVSAQALHVVPSGDVGIGTNTPAESVHVLRDDGTARILVEETNATKLARSLFEIRNNGNPEFRMTNTGNGNSWTFSAGNRFVVKNNAGDYVSRITATGDMEIIGELTTMGGICGGGCDMVFHPDTDIESIEEHASQMWDKSYLPSVGPTVENAPINLSQKTGGMLNELEKAHIYIEQLHKRLAEVESTQASAPDVTIMSAQLEQLGLENQALKESQAQILVLQQQQQNDYQKLKSMLVDLNTRTQSQDVLASLDK